MRRLMASHPYVQAQLTIEHEPGGGKSSSQNRDF